MAIHHNGLGNQLFQWAFGKLVALDAGAAFAARKMREDEGPVKPQRVAPHTIEGWKAFTDVRSRRPVVWRRLHAIFMNRLFRFWCVPTDLTEMLRAGLRQGVARLSSGRRREMCAAHSRRKSV